NSILGVLLTWTIVMTSCDAYCYVSPLRVSLGSQPEGCKDLQGVLRSLKTQWKNNACEICDCSYDGITCCSLVMTPIGYDENNCNAVFDPETCTHIAVQKENPLKPCEVPIYIG
uniref:Beta-microseminoprotein n=2 Tax=Monodelphis domestica TaxID=13616 RepID=A0A5F8HIP3_MONDO